VFISDLQKSLSSGYFLSTVVSYCAGNKGEVLQTIRPLPVRNPSIQQKNDKNINLRVRTPGHEEELLLLARLRGSLKNKKIIT
jgi:hypothetical protein